MLTPESSLYIFGPLAAGFMQRSLRSMLNECYTKEQLLGTVRTA